MILGSIKLKYISKNLFFLIKRRRSKKTFFIKHCVMEVNIKNAFLIILSTTWRFFMTSFENVSLSLQNFLYILISLSLVKPLATTLITLVLILFLSIFVSVSFVILTGVLGLITMILICEGFICLIFLLLAGTLMYLLLLFLTIIHGVQSSMDNAEQQI